jgi:DNA mismatch repair protein MutS
MADVLTPMMQQYRRLRGSIPVDTLLLFRLGDFYELFFEDAKEAANLLNVALTKRNGVPMCGVPYHAAQNYIAKLIKAGRRVAICDQTSEPQPGKIVSRDITHIISAGTVSDLDLLQAKRANYLGAVYADDGIFGFAYADLSTGEFRLTQLQDRHDELARVAPVELLVSEEQKQFASRERARLRQLRLSAGTGGLYLMRHFKVVARRFGCANAAGDRRCGCVVLHQAPASAKYRSCHGAALRCASDHVLSMLLPKPILSWLNPEVIGTPGFPRCSTASRQWAPVNCARGFCGRCDPDGTGAASK